MVSQTQLIAEVASQLFTPEMLLILFLSALFGYILGVIPGLGTLIGIVLLFPLTVQLDAFTAVAMLTVMYPISIYGGSVTAVLVNTPGMATSTVTMFDGYPLTKQGKGDYALGVTLISSIFGGLVGAITLLALAPRFAQLALKATPAIIFAIGCIGIVIMVVVSRGSVLKGLTGSAFGMFLATIGYSRLQGVQRFTFGIDYLQSGLSIIPLAVGLFAVSEALMLIYQGGTIEEADNPLDNTVSYRDRLKQLNQGIVEVLRRPVTQLRSAIIGITIGIFPGAGAVIATFVSYLTAQIFADDDSVFGNGAVSGIISAESANNATAAATLIPTLVLGIPGGAVAAILLGVFQLKNIRVGPTLFQETPELAYVVIISLIIANIFTLVIGYFSSAQISQIARLPIEIIAPTVLFMSILGTYAYNFNVLDSVFVLAVGVLAFGLRKLGFPLITILFGYILSPIIEDNYIRAVQLAGGDVLSAFTAPIPAVILGLSGLILLAQVYKEVARVNIINLEREA